MKTLSIFWGNQANSPTSKLTYRANLESYSKHFAGVLLPEQTHSIDGYIVSDANKQGWHVPKGDYLITNNLDVTIGVLTADCLPIIFFDSVGGVIAVAHAGWRGSVAGIAQIVLKQMIKKFNTKPKDVHIYFGPSAKNCCYEVDQKFIDNLNHDKIALICTSNRDGRNFFDVSRYNMLCLQKCDVINTNFNLQNNVCTICNIGYCSYRKFGEQTGLQLSTVTLR